MNRNTGFVGRGAACTVTTGSVTMSVKAKKALAAEGINARSVKLSAGRDTHGCVYGIEYPCELSGNVYYILQKAGIPYRAYF